jgi:hypothetical protein
MASLQIWLSQATSLVIKEPEMNPIGNLDVNAEHPPAIGLSRRIRPLPAPYEKYQIPMNQTAVQTSTGEVRAYYECFRTLDALRENEPYDRIIVLQHWIDLSYRLNR